MEETRRTRKFTALQLLACDRRTRGRPSSRQLRKRFDPLRYIEWLLY
jgi:hypothetical protein